MSIADIRGLRRNTPIKSPESMLDTVRALGIVPFFVNSIPGYSVEELTEGGLWFDDITLGPWDWKIHLVQSGEIAYGKFLLGGKSAFATIPWYMELVNYRRSLPKYTPEGIQKQVLDFISSHGSATVRELRREFGLKKNQVDTILTKLENQTRVVIGDIIRVYRGEDLHYNGWQTASFCTPDDLFAQDTPSFGPLKAGPAFTTPRHSPAESYGLLRRHILSLAPEATDKQIQTLLG